MYRQHAPPAMVPMAKDVALQVRSLNTRLGASAMLSQASRRVSSIARIRLTLYVWPGIFRPWPSDSLFGASDIHR